MRMTPHARTVDALLRSDHKLTLEFFLTTRRGRGESYRSIATDLREQTDGVVDVTGETIRNWIDSLAEKATA